MANDITKDPIVIDTASASNITTKTFSVHAIRLVSPSATAGDTYVVQDKNGNLKWDTVAVNNAPLVEHTHVADGYGEPLIFEGLKVPTLANGKISLYISSPIPIE
ncbi:MAG: hypothetical protein ACE5IR_22870 [bacterium]